IFSVADPHRDDVVSLFLTDHVHVTSVATLKDATDRLAEEIFDCMVVDLVGAPGSAIVVIESIRARFPDIPIIAYAPDTLAVADEGRLGSLDELGALRRVRSAEVLVEATGQFLRRAAHDL